jgi:hypothetical protein
MSANPPPAASRVSGLKPKWRRVGVFRIKPRQLKSIPSSEDLSVDYETEQSAADM